MNPFKIEGPAAISFSGGRSSGYMLHRILLAHDGVLPDDVIVLFANTGKEMNETLDFVHQVSEEWKVPVTWLEYIDAEEPSDRWRVVTYETASRNGEPFEAVIGRKNYLPNPVTRFCTSEMKIKAMSRFIRKVHGWDAWTSVLGLRGDEQRRVAKLKTPNRDRDERVAPMAQANVYVREVTGFWESHPFDLRLPNMNGKTMHGNCDLCFLKGPKQILSLIREQPARAVWWIEQEARIIGKANPDMALFRSDRPSYRAMYDMALAHGEMFDFDDNLSDCFCTD